MASESPIIFYDIASTLPRRTFAPNPWKTRFALNIKQLSYRTEWVQMPHITDVRLKLGVPANRTLPDGSEYHTLPVLQDQTHNTIIGDSFEIALYLDKTYPDNPRLFKEGTIGLTAAFNAQIDTLFTTYVGLADRMILDPLTLNESMAIFAKRAGVASLGQLKMTDEQRETKMTAFEAALGELAKAYRHTGGTTDHLWRSGGTDEGQAQRGRKSVGPWLDGERPVYADCIVGSWLKMFEACMEEKEWERVKGWQGGLWGRVVDALEEWSAIV